MSLLTDDRGARRARRLLMFAGAFFVLLLGLVGGVLLSGGGDSAPEGSAVPSQSAEPEPEGEGGSSDNDRPVEAPKGSVALPAPERMTEAGVAQGFPKEQLGAVAAGAEYTRALNPLGTAEQLTEYSSQVYIERDKSGGTKQTVALGEVVRGEMDVPLEGEVPTDAALTYTPLSFIAREKSDDQVELWLQVQQIVTRSGSNPELGNIVIGMVMEWDGSDWKQTLGAAEDRPDNATPGSAEAREIGWKSLAFATD